MLIDCPVCTGTRGAETTTTVIVEALHEKYASGLVAQRATREALAALGGVTLRGCQLLTPVETRGPLASSAAGAALVANLVALLERLFGDYSPENDWPMFSCLASDALAVRRAVEAVKALGGLG